MNLEEYKAILKPRLSEKRYHHSVNVAKCVVQLAKRFGADPQKAETAGILHDIMKDAPPEEQLKIIEGSGIILTDVERNAAKLWHAMAGEVYLRQRLGITDPDILNAVRYHTTGRANMSLLEKVIFIADFISEERDYEGVEQMRLAAFQGLEQAMLQGVTFTIMDLASSHKAIHPDTLASYNDVVLSGIQAGNSKLIEMVVTK